MKVRGENFDSSMQHLASEVAMVLPDDAIQGFVEHRGMAPADSP